VKPALVIAALLTATVSVAAQDAPHAKAQPSQHSNVAHVAAPAARPLPVIIPQQFAPPQEAYASLPESAPAAAPAQPSACQLRLAKVAAFQPLPTLVGAGECGATDVVQMDTVILPDQSRIAVLPPAILRCPMAEQVVAWVRDDVLPSLKPFGPPLRALDNFASYDCRGRNNVRAAQMSEHGRADALDVADFRLADGRALSLTDVNVPKDWRETVRATACARFATVLGPGSDGYHEEHIHLDLEPRRNNYKICEWDVRVPPPPTPPPAVVATSETPPTAAEATPAGADETMNGDDPPLIPLDEVPLPRPRPFALRAPDGRRRSEHHSALGGRLQIATQ